PPPPATYARWPGELHGVSPRTPTAPLYIPPPALPPCPGNVPPPPPSPVHASGSPVASGVGPRSPGPPPARPPPPPPHRRYPLYTPAPPPPPGDESTARAGVPIGPQLSGMSIGHPAGVATG